MNRACAPALETDRLRLRPWQAGDAAPYAALYADAHSTYIGGPLTPIEAWNRLAGVIGHWTLRGFGLWAVEAKATQNFVGCCGPVFYEGRHEPEIGWALAKAFLHQGYMREAAKAVLHHLFTDCQWPSIIAVIDDDNASSIRLAESLGFERNGMATDREPPLPRWRLTNFTHS